MYINPEQGKKFINAAYGLGLDFDDDGRGAIPIDIDGDGDLDLAIISLQGLHLAENRAEQYGYNFTRIKLTATKSQHHALGANVRVFTANRTQQDFVKSISGFQSQIPLELHFGLGRESKITKIEIQWPSGNKEEFVSPPINRLLHITEEQGLKDLPLQTWSKDALPPEQATYDLKSPVARLNSKEVPKFPLVPPGKPSLINFWAPWCKPCIKELPVLKKFSEQYKGRVSFVGISVETEKLEDVNNSVKQFGLTYDQVLADTILLESFFGKEGAAALPSTFLFNEAGQLVRAFKRPVNEADLEALLESLIDTGSGVPYLLVLGESAMRRNDFAAAAKYFEDALKEDPNDRYVLTQYGTIQSLGRDIEAGIKTLQQVVQQDADFHYAWAQLGLAYKRQDKMEDAIASYNQALRVNPQNVSYLVQASNILIRLEDFKTAEERLERIIKLEPKEFFAWLNLAKVRHKQGKGTALAAARKALQIRPDDPEANAMVRQLSAP